MVDILAMGNKSNCYVEVVKRNYYCQMDQIVIPKIHLIFLSKSDYKKSSTPSLTQKPKSMTQEDINQRLNRILSDD